VRNVHAEWWGDCTATPARPGQTHRIPSNSSDRRGAPFGMPLATSPRADCPGRPGQDDRRYARRSSIGTYRLGRAYVAAPRSVVRSADLPILRSGLTSLRQG